MGFIDETGRITDPYKNFIHVSRYARWLDEQNRRETWVETVDRYMDFMVSHLQENNGYTPDADLVNRVRNYILNHLSLPSMRAVMTAGEALKRNNIAGYNCSYIVMDDPVAFDETLYILMNGTGVGFSAERRYSEKLPVVPSLSLGDNTIVVEDSKEGWAYAYRELITNLYNGVMPAQYDVSAVRPAGARLKTFGGRASGPQPLLDLFKFTVEKFHAAQGRRLKPIEVHDIVCKIADVVVVGGVRRSALISLGDLEDDDMRHAKDFGWWEKNGQRRLANNSAVYESRPSRDVFDREWKALEASGSGERGIFNREAAKIQAAKFGRRDFDIDYGTNPCSEIILRPNQFCNLSTIVVREDDTVDTLADKAEVASILGTWQSTMTNFKYLRDIWRENTEEERLLGVSMTGPLGNALLNGSLGIDATENILRDLKEVAVEANNYEAKLIGINPSAAVTCIKPEGTTSQKTLTSSGLHPWHDLFYVRTVRQDAKDSLTKFMQDSGFYWEPDVMSPDSTVVFSFPIAAPAGALTRNDLTAIQHLELWLAYQRAWCEHKPSVTVNVKKDEWEEVGNWVYDHFDEISGVSFMPFDEHTYKQAPYQPISEQEYIDWTYRVPANVNWELLSVYETEDETSSSQDLACVAGGCDVPTDNLQVIEESLEQELVNV